MTKILNFTLKIKGGSREGGTCKDLRPCHLLKKIWNVHLLHDVGSEILPCVMALVDKRYSNRLKENR